MAKSKPDLKIVSDEEVSQNVPIYMEIPRTLKIGPFVYSIREMDELESFKSGHLGFCDKDQLQIAVATHIAPQKQVEVLFHEILHACYSVGDLDDAPAQQEEKVVTVLTYQILQAWRDNPEIVAWMANQMNLMEVDG